MVTITVPINPERAASIRAGLDPETASIEVDLDAISQDERNLLADHTGEPVLVATPTLEDLFAALQAAAERENATLAEILEAYRETLDERRVKTWQERLLPSDDATYTVARADWPESGRGLRQSDWIPVMAKHRDKIHEITNSDEALAWARELDAINREAREQARREWHEAEEAKDRARGERIARFKEWAETNGSERVRLLIEENMASWYGVAEDEYFAEHTPAGFTALTDDDEVRSLGAPDAPDIHALRDARGIAAGDDALGEPHLVWIERTGGPDEVTGGPAVRLAITAPNGAEILVWRHVVPQPDETS